ncbi:chromosomal replication initiator protein DnaA [Boudabousia marimammalium]|uniref:Chromosomal replication initiator protein DnaA n=1 Tax=Boudabousia marimammalium TaxID=156892 RepID=A0A1Q5PSL3_9ACTO|nr:chromosomal replication initiator protein DnaA [Boudabousia marimammalium]OKL50561.1 chromosomal replication initiation protein DnaA [Boudabousia marimammalium]
MAEYSLQDAWNRALREVEIENDFVRAVIKATRPLANISGTILLATPHEIAKKAIENQLNQELTAALAKYLAHDVRLAVSVEQPPADEEDRSPAPVTNLHELRNDQEKSAPPSSSAENTDVFTAADYPFTAEDQYVNKAEQESQIPSGPRLVVSNPEIDPTILVEAHLNPQYTFDSFVTGASNRFTSAAARAVAETPARAYNPLFIYGGSGLGKTHLMHAIGHYALSLYPELKVKYVSSEAFTNDFINSIREDRAEQFQRRYREIDILLIDDIQFIQDKEQTMEEFFHTFNALHTANKQVVITSDVPPKKLQGFEDRMRSRFEMGLLTDVQPPDLETRIAILQKKARLDKTEAPPEVLEYIASRISTNIRELEGALIRVTASANLSNQEIDLHMTEMVLKDIITDPDDEEITPSLIMLETADYFGTTVEALCSADRSRMLVDARQIAMYLCRELTDLSLPAIGKEFGGRDHTTVMHANKKIRNSMTQKRQVFNQVSELTNRIKQKARRRY